MEGTNEEVFIAEGREEHVQYNKSYVIEKKKLRTAFLTGKIMMKASNPADPAIEELEANDAAENTAELEDSFKGKIVCPFLQIGFTNTNGGHLKLILKEEKTGSDDEENTSCLDNIIFAKQEIVSRSLISNKLVAAQYHTESGMIYPDPISLSSSMASFVNGKWNKFGIQRQILPSNLIEDCRRSVTSTDKRNKGPDFQEFDQDSKIIELGPVETIGIICGEQFNLEKQEDLNTHVQNRHGGVELFDIPLAVSTDINISNIANEEREAKNGKQSKVKRCKWLEVHEFDSTEEVISNNKSEI